MLPYLTYVACSHPPHSLQLHQVILILSGLESFPEIPQVAVWTQTSPVLPASLSSLLSSSQHTPIPEGQATWDDAMLQAMKRWAGIRTLWYLKNVEAAPRGGFPSPGLS